MPNPIDPKIGPPSGNQPPEDKSHPDKKFKAQDDQRPRDYQKEVVMAAFRALQKGKQGGLVLLPPGIDSMATTVKTAKRLAAVKSLSGKKKLVLVTHSNLVGATEMAFEKVFSPTEILVIPNATNFFLQGFKPSRYGLVVAYGAHKVLTKSWLKVLRHLGLVNKKGSLLKTGGKFLLGVDQSPDRLDQVHIGATFQHELLYSRPLDWYVNNGHLRRPLGMLVERDLKLNDVAVSIPSGDYIEVRLTGKMSTEEGITGIVRAYKDISLGEQALVIASGEGHARLVADAFNQAGIKAGAIDPNTETLLRRQAIRMHKTGEMNVLVRYGLPIEDETLSIQALYMARPTRLHSRYNRMVEGALRIDPDHPDWKTVKIVDVVGASEGDDLQMNLARLFGVDYPEDVSEPLDVAREAEVEREKRTQESKDTKNLSDHLRGILYRRYNNDLTRMAWDLRLSEDQLRLYISGMVRRTGHIIRKAFKHAENIGSSVEEIVRLWGGKEISKVNLPRPRLPDPLEAGPQLVKLVQKWGKLPVATRPPLTQYLEESSSLSGQQAIEKTWLYLMTRRGLEMTRSDLELFKQHIRTILKSAGVTHPPPPEHPSPDEHRVDLRRIDNFARAISTHREVKEAGELYRLQSAWRAGGGQLSFNRKVRIYNANDLVKAIEGGAVTFVLGRAYRLLSPIWGEIDLSRFPYDYQGNFEEAVQARDASIVYGELLPFHEVGWERYLYFDLLSKHTDLWERYRGPEGKAAFVSNYFARDGYYSSRRATQVARFLLSEQQLDALEWFPEITQAAKEGAQIGQSKEHPAKLNQLSELARHIRQWDELPGDRPALSEFLYDQWPLTAEQIIRRIVKCLFIEDWPREEREKMLEILKGAGLTTWFKLPTDTTNAMHRAALSSSKDILFADPEKNFHDIVVSQEIQGGEWFERVFRDAAMKEMGGRSYLYSLLHPPKRVTYPSWKNCKGAGLKEFVEGLGISLELFLSWRDKIRRFEPQVDRNVRFAVYQYIDWSVEKHMRFEDDYPKALSRASEESGLSAQEIHEWLVKGLKVFHPRQFEKFQAIYQRRELPSPPSTRTLHAREIKHTPVRIQLTALYNVITQHEEALGDAYDVFDDKAAQLIEEVDKGEAVFPRDVDRFANVLKKGLRRKLGEDADRIVDSALSQQAKARKITTVAAHLGSMFDTVGMLQIINPPHQIRGSSLGYITSAAFMNGIRMPTPRPVGRP